MDTIIPWTVHLVVGFALPPLLLGIIAKTKAFFAGRIGPPILQGYYDLAKLFQKGSVVSPTTTWVFRAGPIVGLGTAAIAILLVPMADIAPTHPILSFGGDLVLLAYLLGLGRFFTALAALDTGSPFEGMGAAREVTFACLAEPAFFLGWLVLVQLTHSLQLTGILGGSFLWHRSTNGASLALVLISWFIVLLAENCRIPFDDPNTHLELTMIHEVMVLDHSGPALGMILYASSLKFMVFASLIVPLVLPLTSGRTWLDWSIFIGGLLALAGTVGVVESIMARLRLTYVPVLLVAACLLSAFGVVLLMR